MSDRLESPGNAAMASWAWGNCLLFALSTDRDFNHFFIEILFVSFYKIADSVTQHIRNCPFKKTG